MDVQTLLEYLQKRGDIAAFGKIDPAKHDPAISIFGCLVTVVTVRFANVDDYNARRPWDYHPESAVYGYHAVASVGHRDQAADDVRFVTWTREQSFTQAFWAHDVAIWGVILPEHLKSKEFMAGMDLPALADAFQTLTGRVLPIPEVPMEPLTITGAGGGTGTLNLPNPNLRVFRLSDGKDIVPAAKVYQLGPAGNLPNRGADGVCHLAFEAVGGSFEAIAILDRNMVITPPSAHPISLSIDGKSVYSATV